MPRAGGRRVHRSSSSDRRCGIVPRPACCGRVSQRTRSRRRDAEHDRSRAARPGSLGALRQADRRGLVSVLHQPLERRRRRRRVLNRPGEVGVVDAVRVAGDVVRRSSPCRLHRPACRRPRHAGGRRPCVVRVLVGDGSSLPLMMLPWIVVFGPAPDGDAVLADGALPPAPVILLFDVAAVAAFERPAPSARCGRRQRCRSRS